MSVQEIPENYDDTLDQGALNNVNADWVNYKGKLSTQRIYIWIERIGSFGLKDSYTRFLIKDYNTNRHDDSFF